jgi:hypothetical protein
MFYNGEIQIYIFKGDFSMLTQHKNFVIFNRHQADSDLAAQGIKSIRFSGWPTLIGDHYMVTFDVNFTSMTEEEAYREQLENAKAVLEKYKINYRIVTFKD